MKLRPNSQTLDQAWKSFQGKRCSLSVNYGRKIFYNIAPRIAEGLVGRGHDHPAGQERVRSGPAGQHEEVVERAEQTGHRQGIDRFKRFRILAGIAQPGDNGVKLFLSVIYEFL